MENCGKLTAFGLCECDYCQKLYAGFSDYDE